MNALASSAEDLAQGTPAGALPAGAHVQGVAARIRSLAPVLGADADLLHAAAWLHDIGYTPRLAGTSLHALDSARYLRPPAGTAVSHSSTGTGSDGTMYGGSCGPTQDGM